MFDLSQRQLNILKAIIDEYIETAEAVGSTNLEKKYKLGISPATIRNEMTNLTEKGLLKQPHASAGRTPTSLALKFYIKNLMEPQKLSVGEEVGLKEKIWDARFDTNKLLQQSSQALAEKTKALSLALTDQGQMFFAGTANILDMPEFYDIDLTRNVLLLLDHFEFWQELLRKGEESSEPIQILLGNDLGFASLSPCGFVYSRFRLGEKGSGAIGVIGPERLPFARIIPVIEYFSHLIDELYQNI